MSDDFHPRPLPFLPFKNVVLHDKAEASTLGRARVTAGTSSTSLLLVVVEKVVEQLKAPSPPLPIPLIDVLLEVGYAVRDVGGTHVHGTAHLFTDILMKGVEQSDGFATDRGHSAFQGDTPQTLQYTVDSSSAGRQRGCQQGHGSTAGIGGGCYECAVCVCVVVVV